MRKESFAPHGSIFLADARDILPISCDAIVTDPPYGVDFKGKGTKERRPAGGYNQGDDNEIGPEMIRLCMPMDVPMIVYCGIRLLWDYPKPRELGFVSTPGGAGRGRWGFVTGHPILYYGKDPLPQGGQTANGFTSTNDYAEKNGHPCPKPVRWMLWAIMKASNERDTILDPFLGSGTTAIACIRSNRKFIGIEKDQNYFDIACREIENELRQGRLF